MASDSSPVFTSRKLILEILQQLLLFGLWTVISHMVWQIGITHIFTWTNIIIPKHKHISISVFSPGRDTAPDLSYEKMTHFVRAKFTCQRCYWNLHQTSPPSVSFLICRKSGREGRERERKENGKMAQGSGGQAVSSAAAMAASTLNSHHWESSVLVQGM